MKTRSRIMSAHGFTFVEALMTIAILSMMASILISAFSNTAADSNRIIARQQQAAVQSAVNAWVNSAANRVVVIDATAGTGKIMTITEIQTTYNAATTALARLQLVMSYLDNTTATYLTGATTNSAQVSSDALKGSKQHLEFPNWATGSYPQVTLIAN